MFHPPVQYQTSQHFEDLFTIDGVFIINGETIYSCIDEDRECVLAGRPNLSEKEIAKLHDLFWDNEEVIVTTYKVSPKRGITILHYKREPNT